MATSVAYPSARFPGPPHIALEVPDDWEALSVAGVQLAVAQPRIEGKFRANLVVTVQRVGEGYTLEAAQQALEQRKAAMPALEELGTGTIELDGRTWVASEYGYTQPGRRTVVQAARYTVLDRDGAAGDVIEIIGSCGAESADDEIELIRAAQDSVAITI